MVEPYIIIISPGLSAPTESASAAASIVPTVTGVPKARPVNSAASFVTWPAISSDHINRGSFSNGTMSSAKSSTHVCVVTS